MQQFTRDERLIDWQEAELIYQSEFLSIIILSFALDQICYSHNHRSFFLSDYLKFIKIDKIRKLE